MQYPAHIDIPFGRWMRIRSVTQMSLVIEIRSVTEIRTVIEMSLVIEMSSVM